MIGSRNVLIVTITLLLPTMVPAAETAGTKPYARPGDAPVQSELNRDDAWYKNQLYGVLEPYPRSLKFLENQGAWYTPFSNPGMPGRYNIRNW